MIEKKSGKINEIVYNNTVYHNGEYRLYPTLEHLFSILDLIAESGVTTNYLRITPFYRNIKLDIYEEWDVFDFYIECREHVTPSEQDDFWKEHVWWDSPEYSQIQAHLSVDDVKRTKFLCPKDDIESFKRSIQVYKDYLYEAIPRMMMWSQEMQHLSEEGLYFGCFCFEIESD